MSANYFYLAAAALAIADSLAVSGRAVARLWQGMVPLGNAWGSFSRGRMPFSMRGFGRRRPEPGPVWKVWAVVYYPVVALLCTPLRWAAYFWRFL